jgi:hypothetical protein
VPRGADSEADRELTAQLAARGLAGSGARYERWRSAGLLPRHDRHWAGRGRGSGSALAPATVEIAAALARHAGQGRDLRAAVIAWFFEAGVPATQGGPAVPEPPDAAAARALAWAVRTDPGYRMLQRARAAVTEAQKDDFYAVAGEQARRGPDPVTGFDPAAVREALLSGQDIPNDAFTFSGPRADVVHFFMALGQGIEEVGPELFADAIAATGLYPQLTAQQQRDTMTEACACDTCTETFATLMRFDPAEELENAGIERLRRAREVAIGLAAFGVMLMMHAFLMPDTPGLTALRAAIDERGMRTVLMGLALQMTRPRGIAFTIVACLQPTYLALYNSLSELVDAGPPLLHPAGDGEHDPERYRATLLSSIRELSERGYTGTPN